MTEKKFFSKNENKTKIITGDKESDKEMDGDAQKGEQTPRARINHDERDTDVQNEILFDNYPTIQTLVTNDY